MNPLRQREPDFATAPDESDARAQLPTIDAQQLWFRVRLQEWSSLVIVPVGSGGTAAETASRLCEAGRVLSEGPVSVLHAERMEPSAIADLMVELSNRPKSGRTAADQQRLVISVDPVLTNPLGTGIAQAADAALLCVELQKATLADARATIELVGRERFIGSVLFRARKS